MASGVGVLIGQRVARARERRQWNQSDLARRANISVSYINRLESGAYVSPSVTKISQIANALGVGVLDLTEPARPPLPEDVAAYVERISERDPRLAQSILKDMADAPDELLAAALDIVERLLATRKN